MWGAVIGLAMQAGSSMVAAGRQDNLNDMNAALIGQTSAEEERRLQNEQQQTEALAGAISASSGVQTSGSREISIDATKRENKAQLDWLRKSNRSKASAALAGGNIQTSQLKTQAVMSGVQGFAQIAGSLFNNTQSSGVG